MPDEDDLAAKKSKPDGNAPPPSPHDLHEFFESICDGLAEIKLVSSTWERSLHFS